MLEIDKLDDGGIRFGARLAPLRATGFLTNGAVTAHRGSDRPRNMGRYYCDRAYWLMTRDLLILTGQILEGPVDAGHMIDLPTAIRGPGLVPIHSVQEVTFDDRPPELGIVIQWHHIEKAPWMEPSHLEKRELAVI